MTAYATVSDLESRWRTLTAEEKLRAEVLLADAAVWLRTWIPGLDASIATGAVDAGAAVMVSCAMVKRAMLNSESEGLESVSRQQTAGPYSFADRSAFSNPEGNLYLTAREIELLKGRPVKAVSFTAPGL